MLGLGSVQVSLAKASLRENDYFCGGILEEVTLKRPWFLRRCVFGGYEILQFGICPPWTFPKQHGTHHASTPFRVMCKTFQKGTFIHRKPYVWEWLGCCFIGEWRKQQKISKSWYKVGPYHLSRWCFQTFLRSFLFVEMIQFDEHIFQLGWFNHQLVINGVIYMYITPLICLINGQQGLLHPCKWSSILRG